MNYRKTDRRPSYRVYSALQRKKSPMRYICEIFGVPRFRSVSTQSAQSGHPRNVAAGSARFRASHPRFHLDIGRLGNSSGRFGTLGGAHSGLALKAVTSVVPIVFVSADDPIAFGLVSSLSRPNGNVTGISMITVALAPKRLQLLHEWVPAPTGMAMLANSSSPYFEQETIDVMASARALGRKLHVLAASNAMEIEMAFSSLRGGIGALLISGDPYFDGERDRLVSLAARYSVPTVYLWREFATIGGLMSYGTSIRDAYQQAGTYVARILNGDKPADLPVLQPTRLELVINLKTAAALGLSVPATLLARADEIIE
jgi:putative ABC transport system substrate-binding protein